MKRNKLSRPGGGICIFYNHKTGYFKLCLVENNGIALRSQRLSFVADHCRVADPESMYILVEKFVRGLEVPTYRSVFQFGHCRGLQHPPRQRARRLAAGETDL